MKKHLAITLTLLLGIGCGQTGELYLPKKTGNSAQSSSSAAQETTKKKPSTEPGQGTELGIEPGAGAPQ